ncbi:MAG: hypothetical protein QNJ87_03800, partial [Gammaproteobacteria bacterium]|nr:hypothetical protein [Gammaproteobacteria bacterium]
MVRTTETSVARLSRFLILIPLLLLLGMSPPAAIAQNMSADFDPRPLRPADTSSPRATLRTFLVNANAIVEDWRWNPGAGSPVTVRARQRALQTLDFSATPDGSSKFVRVNRALFLKEILDRIEVPPLDAIPGDAEVAEGGITQWTIPDTRITIRRIDKGPRAREFLFSAGTVQRLDRLYRQAKHLPYQPGATAGVYEEYIRAKNTALALEARVRNRLRPADTSSPRSTLEGFLDSINRAYTLVTEAEAALQ